MTINRSPAIGYERHRTWPGKLTSSPLEASKFILHPSPSAFILPPSPRPLRKRPSSRSIAAMLTQRIGLIGAGQMATALGRGFVRAGLISADRLLAADPQADARTRFAKETGGLATADNAEVAAQADVLILAVKPQHIAGVLAELRGKVGPQDAGRLDCRRRSPGRRWPRGSAPQTRLVRVMPNTPCLVGRGACAYCLGETGDGGRRPVGRATARRGGHRLSGEEKLLDAVTGLSGSGPAFVYVVIEALSDGGVRMGLPRAVATALAAQTVLGAGANGPCHRRAPRRAERPRGQPRRDDHRRAAGAGGGRAARRLMAAVGAAARRSIELE